MIVLRTPALDPDPCRPFGLRTRHRALRVAMALVAAAAIVIPSGCSSLASSAAGRMADNLSSAVLNSNDPETVRSGAPAYLLLIDGLVEGDPDNERLLATGARLYAAYTAGFVDDPARRKTLSTKARDYGHRALCSSSPATCGAWDRPYEEFEPIILELGPDDVPSLYVAAASWAGWIQANRDDWNAIADKARVDLMMQRVIELDENHQQGGAHLYLGVLETLLPPALGGRPEKGREHFLRAIEISGGQDLMAKVVFARSYARLVFDRELHDNLCREVLETEPEAPGLTLTNLLAQDEARDLLDSSLDFFGE